MSYEGLTDAEIIEIRARCTRREDFPLLAEKYGVTAKYIEQLVSGYRRPELPGAKSLKAEWHMARDLTKSAESEVLRLFHEGLEKAEIAEAVGFDSLKPVGTILSRHGLSCRDRNRSARDAAEGQIIDLFHQGKQLTEIAEATNLSTKQVATVVSERGLSFRERNKKCHEVEARARAASHQEQLLTHEEKLARLEGYLKHLDAGLPKTKFDGYFWLRKHKLLDRNACAAELSRLRG